MNFLDLLKHRRSIRQYKEEAVSKEALEAIVEAGLLSPSGRNIRPWELIVVQKKETLEKMSECRVGSAKMLAGASAAIVVIADPEKTDVWTEDCSIVMSNMHNMAHDLGLGSCWIQGRLRQAPDGRTTEEYLRDILGYPKEYCLEAVLSIGVPAVHPEGRKLSEVPEHKVHFEMYGKYENIRSKRAHRIVDGTAFKGVGRVGEGNSSISF